MKVIIELQTKRAWFIAHLYKTAVEKYLAINHTPIDWEQVKNHEYLQVKWFEGDQVPPQFELTYTDIGIEESEDEINWDSDKDYELSSDDENESL